MNSRSSMGLSTNSQLSKPNYEEILEGVDDDIFDKIIGENELKAINQNDPDAVDQLFNEIIKVKM
jgi:succinate dehydrogenase flavin-adding protein (antitoxin of CptAB toxin-antitoxin module)